MHCYARHYVRFTQETETDTDILARIHDINTLEVDVARPYLLQLYEDFSKSVVDKSCMLGVLSLIETYVFRRAICGIQTNSLNKTFAALDREIDKSSYLDSVKSILVLKVSYRRFPTDEEFKRELIVKDVYNTRTRNYLLAKLENYQRKEPVNVENYTIEHILPQNPNLRQAWRSMLGDNWKEIQQRVLHTIGNLTLTGYNSEYGDRPFQEKQDIEGGFKESPLRLNHGLGYLAQWTEEEINRRAEDLATKACNIWQFPSVSSAVIAKYSATLSPASDKLSPIIAKLFQGTTLTLFNEARKRIENIDAAVHISQAKKFIAFDNASTFICLVPEEGGIRIILNVLPGDIRDPKGICNDISSVKHEGIGDLSVANLLTGTEQLDGIIDLARQAFELHADAQDDSRNLFDEILLPSPTSYPKNRFHVDSVKLVEAHLSTALVAMSARTKAHFRDGDDNTRLVCRVSERKLLSKNLSRYWFGFQFNDKDFLDDHTNSYVGLGCGTATTTVLIPFKEFAQHLSKMSKTTKSGHHWNVLIFEEPGKLYIRLQDKSQIDVSSFVLKRPGP
jgi:predicted transport protein